MMAASFLSLVTGFNVDKDAAFTGSLDLRYRGERMHAALQQLNVLIEPGRMRLCFTNRGRVTKVSDVAPKSEAAVKAGVKKLVCPVGNVEDVPNGLPLTTSPVSNLSELLACALELPSDCQSALDKNILTPGMRALRD